MRWARLPRLSRLSRLSRRALLAFAVVLLALGTQSALYSPTKYAIMPELVRDDAPRFNLTRAGPRTFRLGVLYGARPGGRSERVVTLHVTPEDGGCLVQATLRRFSGPSDAAAVLGRGMLSGMLVMVAVFVDPGTVIGGLFWHAWEGMGRVGRRLSGKGPPPPNPEDLPPTAHEALVVLLGELFTPVSRASAELPPTPFRE